MPPCLEATHGADGQPPFAKYLALRRQAPPLSSFGETTGLQKEAGHDAEGIVQFQKVHVFWRNPRLLVSTSRRESSGLQRQRVGAILNGKVVCGNC